MAINLTVYLIDEELTDDYDILEDRNDSQLRAVEVRVDGAIVGLLYYKRRIRRQPDWVMYLGEAVTLTGPLDLANLDAVLITGPIEGRRFALTFGQAGRFLLALDVWEPRFGLLVAMNMVDPARISAVNHRRLQPISRQTQEQLGQASGIAAFAIDTEQDILRAVTAMPEDERFGTRITG